MAREDSEEIPKPLSKADVVWHPVRLRIMNALSPNRHLTVPQIGALLPDVAPASPIPAFKNPGRCRRSAVH